MGGTRKSATCQMRSSCGGEPWKYKAVYRSSTVHMNPPCSPCRSPCPPSHCPYPPPGVCCHREERFASDCSPVYTPPARPVCRTSPPPCCRRDRFSSSCSSPARGSVEQCDAEVHLPPCDLDRYCIRSSPISCNPCLGRRSFRHCSSFTRPSTSYCDWCVRGVRESTSSEQPRKKSRRASRKSRVKQRSSAANANVQRTSSASSVSSGRRSPSRTRSDETAQSISDPNKQVFTVGKRKDSRKSKPETGAGTEDRRRSSDRKASAADADRRRTSSVSRRASRNDSTQWSVGDAHGQVENAAESRKSEPATDASVADVDDAAAAVGDDEESEDDDRRRSSSKRRSSSQRASRKSSAADDDEVARRSSGANESRKSEPVNDASGPDVENIADAVADEEELNRHDRRRSSSRKASRKSSAAANENTRRDSPNEHDEATGQRNLNSAASAGSYTSVTSGDSSRKARFSSSAKSFSQKTLQRRQTPYRSSRQSSSSSSHDTSRSTSSRSSAQNRNERRSTSSRSDCQNVDGNVKPLAEYIKGIIRNSVAVSQCERGGHTCPVSQPRGDHCTDRRCSPDTWNPRGRFSLSRMPFYRAGHRPFTSTCRLQPIERQPEGASIVSVDRDRQRYGGGGTVEFVPGAPGAANRQAPMAASTGYFRSNSLSSSQNAAFIASMPPPGTSVPRSTVSSSSRQVPGWAASRPRYAGYREHYVTTTNRTVRQTHEQNFNYTGNAAARRSSEDAHRGLSGAVDNRNQSGTTSAPLNSGPGNVVDAVTEAHHTTSASAASSQPTSYHDHELDAMFQEAERGIMEAFETTRKILQ